MMFWSNFFRDSQILVFGLIGLANTLAHGAVLILLVEELEVNVTLSHLFSFAVANLFSYIMNSRFTFKAELAVARYVRFVLASLLSLCLVLSLSWLTDVYGLHYLVGFGLIVLVAPFLNFLIMKFWAFGGDNGVP